MTHDTSIQTSPLAIVARSLSSYPHQHPLCLSLSLSLLLCLLLSWSTVLSCRYSSVQLDRSLLAAKEGHINYKRHHWRAGQKESCGFHLHTHSSPSFVLPHKVTVTERNEEGNYFFATRYPGPSIKIIMAFSSLPIFLDPPSWGQMQMQQQPPLQCLLGVGGGGGSTDHHHLMPPPSGLAPLPGAGPSDDTAARAPAAAGGSSTSVQQQAAAAGPAGPPQQARPVVSMAERARLARVPFPEPGTLRCPRCDSANTKFCYFNNYSLSQPRHFCKACRRYWTRGGALRNVPVGGGCRRNTKRSSSKKSSSSRGGGATAAATSSSSTTSTSTTATTTSAAAMAAAAEAIAGMHQAHQLPPHLGLGLPPAAAAAAALEASLEGYHHHYLPLQMQPQSFLQQAAAGLHGYHFADDGTAAGVLADHGFPRGVVASGLLAQLAAVKMEEYSSNGGGGAVAAAHHEQAYWPGSTGGGGGSGWPAEFLSGFSSSSSGNVL